MRRWAAWKNESVLQDIFKDSGTYRAPTVAQQRVPADAAAERGRYASHRFITVGVQLHGRKD